MNRDKLQIELLRDEGQRLKPYLDTVGKLTIGIGRNLDDVGVSEDEVALMLKNDIDRVEQGLKAACPWYSHLTDARQRALCNLCFNLGLGGLLGFRKAMKAMQAGQYDTAADEFMDSLWAKQVGARADRITTLIRQG